MICIDTLHVGLNRFLLLVVGLWPYQQSKFVRFQVTLFFGILASFILFQFAAFLTLKCTPDLLVNVLSSALFHTMFAIKYISFSINTKIVKYLLEQLQHMHNELTDKNEINIIEKYGNYAKSYTIAFLLLVVTMVLSLTLYLFWPHIFNILFFTNETRSRLSLPYMTEYFVDQEKYLYLILFHANAAFAIGAVAMLATGTMLVFYQQHACGMFRIARRITYSYRIERAMTFRTLQKNSLENENLVYKGLICAVDMHRRAMKLVSIQQFSNLTVSRFKVMFSLLIIVGVISASLNFFRIFQVISFGYNAMELSLPVMILIIQLVYMMITNYLAQEIMDHNNDIYVTVYKVQWYMASLQTQKLILFLLQRSTKAFTMNIAGLFVGSLEVAEYRAIIFHCPSFCATLT
ncbi:uncharacterized protein [Temnothorax longispinosus]|uniref:uncharacterized protein isoform X2 n=1 Tax=Temnothorax longispinosus TaxID=300112 RepID=UPI003A996862